MPLKLIRKISSVEEEAMQTLRPHFDKRIGETTREMERARALAAEFSHWESLELSAVGIGNRSRRYIKDAQESRHPPF